MKNLASRIIFELSKDKDGLTNAELLRAINDRKLTAQLLNYYLNEFVKTKVLKKSGTKYILLRTTFIINGSAVIEFNDKLMFLDCPYYGNECKQCLDNHLEEGESCLFIEGLPDFLKKIFL